MPTLLHAVRAGLSEYLLLAYSIRTLIVPREECQSTLRTTHLTDDHVMEKVELQER
jgi:hypothetical protein